MKRRIFAMLLCALLIAAAFSGCGSKDAEMPGENFGGVNGAEANNDDIVYDKDEAGEPSSGSGIGFESGGIGSVTERKQIQYVTIEMETLDYDKTISDLKSNTSAVGGYIETSRETGRSVYSGGEGVRRAEFVLRVPVDRLDGFKDDVSALGNVTSQYTNTKDVTESYFDTEARLKSLTSQRDRYMELLDNANDMTYIIELTNALTDVIYQIEQLTGTLNKYDSLIAYSTVTVNVTEVKELTEDEDSTTFGKRVSNAFSDSIEAFSEMWQSIAVGLVAALPFLIIPGAAAVIVVIVCVRHAKKKSSREKREDTNENNGGSK